MTLIIAIPTQSGVVFGSDSQVTVGQVRSTAAKILQLNDRTLWSASGELALIQRVSERLNNLPQRNQPLSSIRDNISLLIKGELEAQLRCDFRTQFVNQNPESLLGLHPADFLFVEYRSSPKILHVLTNGTSEWVDDRFAATGSGGLFAHALLQKYPCSGLTLESAKLLAFKVIDEAIQIGAYGLGPPIDIWQVDSNRAFQLQEAEIAALGDSAQLLRQHEVEMLSEIARPSPGTNLNGTTPEARGATGGNGGKS